MSGKPNCYECKWRHDLPGDAHSGCGNNRAHVQGHPHGLRMGWFFWPYNFDPTWLESCDGFEAKDGAREPELAAEAEAARPKERDNG